MVHGIMKLLSAGISACYPYMQAQVGCTFRNLWHHLVEILAGKDKGKQGKVSVVARKQHQVIVSGMNTHIRVLPPSGEFPGGRVPSEAPLHISNVALVDPKDGKPCRVKHMYTEEGVKVRVSRHSGSIIPKPPEVKERRDFKSRSGYIEGPKDTTPDDVTVRTYVPTLLTFEEEMQQLLVTKTKKEATPLAGAQATS
eukprot:Em0009g1296a